MEKIIQCVENLCSIIDLSSKILIEGIQSASQILCGVKINRFKPLFVKLNKKIKRIKYTV